jgi:hypothetical protein
MPTQSACARLIRKYRWHRHNVAARAQRRVWQLAVQEVDELFAQLTTQVEGVASGSRSHDHAQLERARRL